MSEANDQPVAEDTSAPGVVAETPAATDDIDTEAFDRMPAPEGDEDASLETGDDEASEPTDKPAADAGTVEVEDETGTKHRIPKALEGAFLRDRDYRQKTQALAEQKRTFEAQQTELASRESQQAESFAALRAEHIAVQGHEQTLAAIETELAKYSKVTPQEWGQLQEADPGRYDQLRKHYEVLRLSRSTTEDALTAAKKDLSSKETAFTESQRSARTAAIAKAWEETHQALEKQIEGWSPKRFQDVAKFAVEQLGYKPEDLREAADPRPWKTASDLMDAKAEIAALKITAKQQTTTQNIAKAQTVQPAERPRGNAQPTKPVDGIGTKEWMRRRTAQVSKKA